MSDTLTEDKVLLRIKYLWPISSTHEWARIPNVLDILIINQPDAELYKWLEELEKSNAEMENELIDRLASALDGQKRLYKYTKDLHEKTVGDFTNDLNKTDKGFEEWKAVVLNSLEQKVGRLERQNRALDSELTDANQSLSRAREDVQRLKVKTINK
ncbi:hypothetical protein NEUTE1DRAFT_141323 [Neurospora tetrasperma FGSC 2508]|uniref:Uncharacterized protein n=1 Tax=Neurospora tetrasperma (strain FGSC 2508 / ATCC MYA-4615 / P0657) TaxID=510951 RepID=F8MYH1_NEUT8|nr:uncharacterized protein NEUTE1DRAFT_141323 [Neurospora tetrasperma FGSC 2508]EGO51368.1 hypothetical protein NEUTE1DRAFT_141323 [Neurospora tetrasperma FGSC 2508]EGZ78663.1 hypothetical protein NEUTE2DRAFT_163262 [Neurospora tetrasperma FGSC 2509]